MATAKNTGAITFAEGAVGDDATYVHLYDAAAAGTLKTAVQLTGNPAALQANEFYRIPAEMVVLTQTPGANEDASFAVDSLNGRVANALFVAMATGAGSATELSTPGRVELAAGDWTVEE